MFVLRLSISMIKKIFGIINKRGGWVWVWGDSNINKQGAGRAFIWHSRVISEVKFGDDGLL